MELKTQVLATGQEIMTGDVSRMGDSGGLADDRLLADLLRLPIGNTGVAKAVLPFGMDGSVIAGFDTSATVSASGNNDATVRIAPFRVVIGSRTTVGIGGVTADALKGWRDIRSAVFAGGQTAMSTSPATSIYASQVIAPGSGGALQRWDLVYAIVTPDAAAVTGTRAVKDPVTGGVRVGSTVTAIGTAVTIGYVQGTPSSAPTLPPLPADTATAFYVALAYVLVPSAFNANWPVVNHMILPVATPGPSVGSRGLGLANLGVANAPLQSTSALASWANNTTSISSGRPGWIMVPELRGSEDLLITLDLRGSDANAWSHVNGGLVDNSRDWRHRIFKTMCFAQSDGVSPAAHFPWDYNPSLTHLCPTWSTDTTTDQIFAGNAIERFGQSFIADAANLPGGGPAGGGRTVVFVSPTSLAQLGGGGGLALYVDTSGALRVYVNGTGNHALVFFWMRSCGPLPAY